MCRDAYFRRKAEERKEKKASAATTTAATATSAAEVTASKVEKKGAVLRFEGLTKTDTTREDLKVPAL